MEDAKVLMNNNDYFQVLKREMFDCIENLQAPLADLTLAFTGVDG